MAFNRPWGPSSSWDRPRERFDSSSNLPGFEWWKPQNTGENRFMSRDHPGYRGPLADISEEAGFMPGRQIVEPDWSGRGRRAADRGVQAYENPFNTELAEIVRRRDQGDVPGAKAQLEQAWNRYRQGISQGFAQGGKDALVAQQSLNNPLLKQTADSIAQSLGVGALSWERNQTRNPFVAVTGTDTRSPGGPGFGLPDVGNVAGNVLGGILNRPSPAPGPAPGPTPSPTPGPYISKPYPPKTPDAGSSGADLSLERLLKILEGLKDREFGKVITPPAPPTPPTNGDPWWKRLGDLIGENVDEPWARVLGMGANVTGRALQARALGDYNERLRERTAMMDRLGGEERARRDYYAQTLMPNLLRGTGHTPQQLAKRMGQFPVSQAGRRI